MLTYDDLPDPGLLHGKTLTQKVPVPAYHKTLIKTSKSKSIITQKFNLIFWEKATTSCYGPSEILADNKDCLSDINGIT